MSTHLATARSCTNIALIKYWGNQNNARRIPANGSISMNLAGLETVTTVRFAPELSADCLTLNGVPQIGPPVERVSQHLDNIRNLVSVTHAAQVISRNTFPAGTGLASSASAFAALTVAACAALGLKLKERPLSALARLGSGSACRSVPSGYVEWYPGYNHDTSYAASIAPPGHWNLIDLVTIVSKEHKTVGSTDGHLLASTSPLQAARVEDAPRRLDQCRFAILARDFDALAAVVEHDALLMHAVMMTSRPALIYWTPSTLRVIEEVRTWRAEGTPVCFTIDAGPNVHVITTSPYRERLAQALQQLEGVQTILTATPGGPACSLDEHLST